ncbi:MAG: hypothetical protein K2X82_26235, partial [Gemmataceae bacterium]|nr:hypothetical protein [Gemmataceae bacterium]
MLVSPPDPPGRRSGWSAGCRRPHRRRIALAALLTTAGCLLTLAVPLVVQRLVDRAAGRSGP